MWPYRLLLIAWMQNCTLDILVRNDWSRRKRVPILRAREDSWRGALIPRKMVELKETNERLRLR